MPAVRLLLLASLALGMSACAQKPPASDAAATQEYNDNNDPLEPLNRVNYAITDKADTYVLAPVARAYRYAVPEFGRHALHNLLQNMTTPVLFINDVVQTKPRRAGDTFMRFVINTTAGVGGMFDVAGKWGYPYHSTDFGQTMALWGIPSGPFLFIPLIGPSNPRDASGYVVDIAFDPLTYVPTGHGLHTLNQIRTGLAIVDARSEVLDETDSIKKTALDPYATLRSLFRQNRQNTIQQLRDDNRATVPNWYAK
jgi:phospholipid-binding lipoprotein MlaA